MINLFISNFCHSEGSQLESRELYLGSEPFVVGWLAWATREFLRLPCLFSALSSWGGGNCNHQTGKERCKPKQNDQRATGSPYSLGKRGVFICSRSCVTCNNTGKECGCVWATHFKNPTHNFGILQTYTQQTDKISVAPLACQLIN